jgi:flagellar FliL protein
MSDTKKSDKAEAKADGKAAAKGGKKGLNKKHKQIIIFAGAGLIFISLMAGGSLFLIKSLNEEDPVAALEAKEESAKAAEEEHASGASKDKKGEETVKSTAVYIPLQPAFVANFEGTAEQHFIQIEVTLVTRDASAEDAMRTHMPLLRNALVMLFGSQSFDDMQTMEGKEKLRHQALLDLQEIL